MVPIVLVKYFLGFGYIKGISIREVKGCFVIFFVTAIYKHVRKSLKLPITIKFPPSSDALFRI